MLGPSLDRVAAVTVAPPFPDLGAASPHGMRLTSMEAGGAGYVARQPISGVGRIRLSCISSSFSGIRDVIASHVAFLAYGYRG